MATIRFGEITKADIPDRNQLHLYNRSLTPSMESEHANIAIKMYKQNEINDNTWLIIENKFNSIINTDSRWIIHYFIQLKFKNTGMWEPQTIDVTFIYVDNFGNAFTDFTELFEYNIPLSEDKIKEIKTMKSNCDFITYTPQLTINSHTSIQSTRYEKNYINIDTILLNVYRIKTNFIMQQLFNRIVALESKKTVTASSCTFEDLLELESK